MTVVLPGYALMRMPRDVLSLYEASPIARGNPQLLGQLRAALSTVDIAAYRGISRDPLDAFPDRSPAELRRLERDGVDLQTNARARRLVLEHGIPSDPDLLPTRSMAEEVYAALERPTEYEIVALSRDPAARGAGWFGFDVGYWGGDHFSLVCDTAIAPRWHPPWPEDFEELAEQLRALNEFALFPTRAGAETFRSWYQTKHWAETEMEPGQFCVIAVGPG